MDEVLEELYVLKVLVLVQNSPFEDTYYQIELSEEKYTKLLDFLVTEVAGEDPDGLSVPVTDELPAQLGHRRSFV